MWNPALKRGLSIDTGQRATARKPLSALCCVVLTRGKVEITLANRFARVQTRAFSTDDGKLSACEHFVRIRTLSMDKQHISSRALILLLYREGVEKNGGH